MSMGRGSCTQDSQLLLSFSRFLPNFARFLIQTGAAAVDH
jgi:hypothetical protein